MILLDAATVLLQWAVGGLAFLWFTTRRHEIGLGYAMLLRITYGVFAAGACGFGLRYGVEPVREVSAVAVAVAVVPAAPALAALIPVISLRVI